MVTSTSPSVSIVIPALDAAGSIERSLAGATSQDYPGQLEVVVALAAGPGEDATRHAIQQTGGDVVVVPNPGRSAAAGLNAAVTAATGEVIVRCDAHAVLPPWYVTKAVETLLSTGADNVGGRQVPRGQGFFSRVVALAMTHPLGAGDARYRIGGEAGPTDTVYLGVFRKSTLVALGGFDETLDRNQDYELNWRIRQGGGTVWFDPELAVEYEPRPTPGALWRQYFDYGKWKRRMLRRHLGSVRPRQLAAPLVLIALATATVLLFTPWRMWGAAIWLGYTVLLLLAAAMTALRRQAIEALVLPFAWAVMHLAWGSGFLLGRQPSKNAR
jgi:glycosyltransferase involved in cell wall biosynthesis